MAEFFVFTGKLNARVQMPQTAGSIACFHMKVIKSFYSIFILTLSKFQLQSPEEKTDILITITPSILCQPLSTPVELLVKPFRTR